jgi:hypothetical protein
MEVLVLGLAIGGYYVYQNQKNKEKEKFKNIKLKEAFVNLNSPEVSSQRFDEQQRYENSASMGNKVGNIIHNNQVYEEETPTFVSSNKVMDNITEHLMPEMVHTNMNPLSGPKPRGAIYGKDLSESYFDNRIGNVSQETKFLRGAQPPLFAPTPNVSWVNGSPNTLDYQREHQYVSKMNNGILPFKQMQVGPDINLNDRELYMPKNVDELRTITNPKVESSLEGYEGSLKAYVPYGNDLIQNGLENYESKRLFPIHENSANEMPAASGISYQTMLPDYVELGNIRSNESQPYFGSLGGGRNNGNLVHSQHSTIKRCADLNPNPIYPVSKTNNILGEQPIGTKTTTRASDESSFYAIAGIGAKYMVDTFIAPLTDVLRHTRKEDLIENGRIFGVVNGGGYSTYSRNTNDMGRQTLKEQLNTRQNIPAGGPAATYSFNKNQYLQERDNNREEYTNWFGPAGYAQEGVENYGAEIITAMHNPNTKGTTEYIGGMNAKVYAPVVGKQTRKK